MTYTQTELSALIGAVNDEKPERTLTLTEKMRINNVLSQAMRMPEPTKVLGEIANQLVDIFMSKESAAEVISSVADEVYSGQFTRKYCGECECESVVDARDNRCVICGNEAKSKYTVYFSFSLTEVEAADEFDAEDQARDMLNGLSLFDLDLEIDRVEDQEW